MDIFSETRLHGVHPVLAEKIRKIADLLAGEGILIRVVQALRTVGQQNELFAQGRRVGDPRPRVTNCRGGYSYHNFGLAVDCCPSMDGVDKPFTPDWNPSHPSWTRMVAIGTSFGLDSGAKWRTFKDYPHFQYTGKYPEGEPPDELRALLQNQGIQAVWDAVTKSVS